jgi:D-alanyl-D-alanine carboxypeptidase/D-alanyl-D-alanine-endopeptidase (penicillin-binding protein 4)
MKRCALLLVLLFISSAIAAQTLQERLKRATSDLLADPQMRYGMLGWLVIDADTGDTLVSWNPHTGLPPASCLKIITSATAFELLGPSFRFSTAFLTDGEVKAGVLNGNLFIEGAGDPALGSQRFISTRPDQQLSQWMAALQASGIQRIRGQILPLNNNWSGIPTPGGYTWNDIGNYYGAGSEYLNWRENQYDLILRSGARIGDRIAVVTAKPFPVGVEFKVEATAAEKGTGDRANIYLAPRSKQAFVDGTIPRDEDRFVISGSLPDPPLQLTQEMTKTFRAQGLPIEEQRLQDSAHSDLQPLMYHYSPSFDSLNYWFMKKSVNLYGEAFIRAIAKQQGGTGSLDEGLNKVRAYWKDRGIALGSLRMLDGSGLSPQNRVTASALVRVLQYASQQWWFNEYLQAFPRYNNMTLKSGTIGGVKSFAGYHTTSEGKNVILAILINNYEGSAGTIVTKMFTLLDELNK